MKTKEKYSNFPYISRPKLESEYTKLSRPLEIFTLEELRKIAVDAAFKIVFLEQRNRELWKLHQSHEVARSRAPQAKHAKDPIQKAKKEIEQVWLARSHLGSKRLKRTQFAREMSEKYSAISQPERTISGWIREWEKRAALEQQPGFELPKEWDWFWKSLEMRPEIYKALNCDPLIPWFLQKVGSGTPMSEVRKEFLKMIQQPGC